MPKTKKEELLDQESAARRSTVTLIIQSVLLLIAILAYLYFTAQTYIIECKKDEGGMITCSTRTTVLGLLTLEKNSITGMAAATVGEECQGAACKYRLELYDNQGVAHPVEQQYSADNVVKERLAKLLNEFVTQPDKREITLKEQVDWLVFMLPLTGIAAFVIYRMSLAKPK